MKFVAPRWTYLAVGSLGLIAAAACSASDGSTFGEDGGNDASGGGTNVGGNATTSTGDGGIMLGTGGGSTGTGTGNTCTTDPDVDDDMDGFTDNEGDCNDCDPNTNPGAVEVATPTMGMGGAAPAPADENCDGTVDEPFMTCDAGIDIADGDPMNGAKAVGLCKTTTANDPGWGVLNAQWVRADGSPSTVNPGIGILSDFGTNVLPRRGDRMLGLSSGYARDAGDAGNCGGKSCSQNGSGTPPAGFPQDVPGCSGGTNINDDVALEVSVRAPTNASGYTFDFDFYSFEYPEWVCTTFNDQFIALVSPPPMGSVSGNISFDSMSNPVSVNIAFFDVCSGCSLGTTELVGTGFDLWDSGGISDAGATSWLVTQAPVEPGSEFTIRWAIWDTGDTAWDSTALIDNFTWIADSGEPVEVGTTPIPK